MLNRPLADWLFLKTQEISAPIGRDRSGPEGSPKMNLDLQPVRVLSSILDGGSSSSRVPTVARNYFETLSMCGRPALQADGFTIVFFKNTLALVSCCLYRTMGYSVFFLLIRIVLFCGVCLLVKLCFPFLVAPN